VSIQKLILRMNREKCNAAIDRVKITMMDRAQRQYSISGDGAVRLYIHAMAHAVRRELGLLDEE
jgi:hypothetical protein